MRWLRWLRAAAPAALAAPAASPAFNILFIGLLGTHTAYSTSNWSSGCAGCIGCAQLHQLRWLRLLRHLRSIYCSLGFWGPILPIVLRIGALAALPEIGPAARSCVDGTDARSCVFKTVTFTRFNRLELLRLENSGNWNEYLWIKSNYMWIVIVLLNHCPLHE